MLLFHLGRFPVEMDLPYVPFALLVVILAALSLVKQANRKANIDKAPSAGVFYLSSTISACVTADKVLRTMAIPRADARPRLRLGENGTSSISSVSVPLQAPVRTPPLMFRSSPG